MKSATKPLVAALLLATSSHSLAAIAYPDHYSSNGLHTTFHVLAPAALPAASLMDMAWTKAHESVNGVSR